MSTAWQLESESEGGEQWRAFCAIELPQELCERASAHAAQLRKAVPDARASWPRAENLHLTLKFLGEIQQERVAALSRAAMRAAERSAPFDLRIEGAGSFPTRGSARVLWLGVVDESRALAGLQKNLEEECANEGFKREERPFRPHLTIARLRSTQGAHQLARLHQERGFEPIEFAVEAIIVLRSELGPGGPRYTEISRHPLGANPAS